MATRQLRAGLLAVLVMLGSLCSGAHVAAVSVTDASSALAAPLFAWSSNGHAPCFRGAEDGGVATTSYQVMDDGLSLLRHLVRPGSGAGPWSRFLAPGAATPDITLVVLGSQLKPSDLGSRALRKPLQGLQGLLTSADSSVAMPYVLHEAVPAAMQRDRLAQLARDVAADVVVGCGGPTGQQALADALQARGGSSLPAVVVLCTNTGGAAAGTPEAAAAELQQVADAHAAVAVLGRRQVTVYAVAPDTDALLPQQRRQLLKADVGTCDALCQVKWLEGILAAFILCAAAVAGMSCLYLLDTPTRFEKAKEGGVRNE